MTKTKDTKLRRAVSISELMNKNYKSVPFEGEWLASYGRPQITGSWIIWGSSSNGKTTHALQILKNFARLGYKCAYNSLEEGLSLSMKDAFIRVGMADVKTRIMLLDKEPIDELKLRLRRKKSPKIIVIDSIQYTGMTYSEYKDLKDEFRDKLFIFVSHANGKNPSGSVACKVKYDAFVKVSVEGYTAYPMSRYGGSKEFVVWEEGANQL